MSESFVQSHPATVSAETAHRIWTAHHEIAQAEKLLAHMRDRGGEAQEVTPRDAFGRFHSRYEFGVPSGSTGHRLYGVSPKLAVVVVQGHIAEMQRDLAEACAVAALELAGGLGATDTSGAADFDRWWKERYADNRSGVPLECERAAYDAGLECAAKIADAQAEEDRAAVGPTPADKLVAVLTGRQIAKLIRAVSAYPRSKP